jgi:glutaredoxin
MKLYFLLIAAILFTSAIHAQENDIEIFEKKDGNKNIVIARNIGKVSYMVKLNIKAEGMIVSPGITVEGVVPPGYMKEMATLEPKPGVGWSYGYDVSFVEYKGQPSTTSGDKQEEALNQSSNSAVKIPIPPASPELSSAPIIVYTREGCGRCSYIKKEMKEKQIDFFEVDINDGSAEANNMWKLLRDTGFTGTTVTMPVVKINGVLHYNIKDMAGLVEGINQ